MTGLAVEASVDDLTNSVSSRGIGADLHRRASYAAAITGSYANAVDSAGRFPDEALTALRQQRLLGIMIPRELGGEGASIAEVADVCYMLGRSCASTAMIYAMHQVKLACLVRHAGEQPSMHKFMRRIAAEQWLVASSTTEGNNGGNVRSSEAPVEITGKRMRLDRQATCISYGQYADAIMTTARRQVDAAKSDQVLVLAHKDSYTLTSTGGWNTLGMRGTVSEGFRLQIDGPADMIMATPYALIHSQSMVPTAHIFWSSAWTGIASAALEKARRFVSHVMRASGGRTPPGAVHLARAMSTMRSLRALLNQAIADYEARAADPDALGALDFQNRIVMLKVEASELAAEITQKAMRITGLAGYREDGDFSICRHLRDVMSAPIMIHNDRILENVAAPSIMMELPDQLVEA